MSKLSNHDTTRRGALGSLAAVAAMVPASAVAAAVCIHDPVFSLIEGHRAAAKAFSDAVRNEPVIGTVEHDEWDARAVFAGDLEAAATEALFSVPPTTIGGAVALLQYVNDVEERGTAGELLMHAMCGDNAGYAFNALVSSLIVALAPLVQK